MIIAVPLVGLLLAFTPLIWQFHLLDLLIQREHTHHLHAWEKDGRPTGFFWSAPDKGFVSEMRSYSARNRVGWTWLSTDPDWAKHDKQALDLLRRWRKFHAISLAAGAVWFVSMMCLSLVTG